MTTFEGTKTSRAVVAHPRAAVWAVLTDPARVARLTPLVRGIEAHGDHWTWRLAPIEVLGHSIGLDFTERMEFDAGSQIRFSHDPSGSERAGVEGRYTLSDAGHGTRLGIELTVRVDLPFPRLAGPAVKASMQAVLAAMGTGFGRNLERELGAGG